MSVLFFVGSQHWAQRPAHSWPSAALVSRWMGLLRTWSEMKREKDWVETNAVQGHMDSGSRILKAQNGGICGRQRLWVQILPPPPTECDWATNLAPSNHSLLKGDNNSLQLWGLHGLRLRVASVRVALRETRAGTVCLLEALAGQGSHGQCGPMCPARPQSFHRASLLPARHEAQEDRS